MGSMILSKIVVSFCPTLFLICTARIKVLHMKYMIQSVARLVGHTVCKAVRPQRCDKVLVTVDIKWYVINTIESQCCAHCDAQTGEPQCDLHCMAKHCDLPFDLLGS